MYLETLLFGIAPHFLIMTGLAINAIDHDEREVSVVDLFLEGLDQAGPVTGL